MKVLLVCHRYPPVGVAGVERISAQTAEALIERGHDVTVLTRQPSESPSTPALRRDTRAGVPVVSIVGGGLDSERFPTHESVLERIFERMLIELAPDVVLVAHLMSHSPGYVGVAHRWGIPVVLELHDFFALCPRAHLQRRSGELCDGPEGGAACARHCFKDQRDAHMRWALRAQSFAEAVLRADEVLAPSRFVATAFESLREGGAPIRLLDNAVAPMGPTLRVEPEAAAPLRLALIGVTVEHKGFQVVVEALRRAALPAARYTIFGALLKPLLDELRDAADGVPGLELHLVSGISPPQLPVLLADVDAVVVPSIVPETYSIVAREAFACGLPVIASAIGALPDAIRPGDNGWLFEPGNATDLAALLQRLDGNRRLLRRAAAGILPEDTTSVAARTDRIEALLVELADRDDPHGGDPAGAELRLMREALVADPDAALG
jgi:glycosyltransferase involved in cell wall biosynthesis